MSYDKADEIERLYKDFARVDRVSARYSIRSKNKSWMSGQEFIISPRNLNNQMDMF